MRNVAVVLAVFSMGCVTTAPSQRPPPELKSTELELTVREADGDLVNQLQAEFAKVAELRSATLKSHAGKVAVFTINYPGPVNDLPNTLSSIPHPGLKYVTAVHKYEYSSFDNQPPTITFVFPQAEQVLNTREQFVTVEVPDKDIASVSVGSKAAALYKGNIYRLKTELAEGRQVLMATAKDKSGNETTAQVAVTIDTTAPALQAQIKLLIEGTVEPGSSVLINGLEIPVDSNGSYRAEVPVIKGQRKIEIIAIDKSGNKAVTIRQLGD
ncbi:MAG: hypothetical protein H6Q89_5428 [Myxococcaceae bacterium]|nr:hypothetical protein [Myxococcaceae bacterium]